MILTSILAFVRREVISVARQPRLLVTMVLGPFLVLLAFGLGYRNERLVLRAVFVAPENSPLARDIEETAASFTEFVDVRGVTDDPLEARRMLRSGEVDAVVALPADPLADVMAGQHAEVVVVHDKLDPIQQAAIGFAARLAVDELNDEILARLVGTGQEQARSLREIVNRLDVEPPGSESAAGRAAQLAQVDAEVLVAPFASSTTTASPEEIDITDFFAPAALALLLQHVGVSLGSLTFVRDRELGLFETYRVGPLTTLRILVGKYLGFTLVGAAVAVPLFALIHGGLEVPLAGDPLWAAAGLALLVVASLGIGLVLSLVARSVSQAVQYAMLVLLAALFLGGVFLDLERLRLPVEVISWLLPVTHAISLLQDVMLRGEPPRVADVVGLGVLAAAAAALVAVMLRRELRTR